MSPYIHVGRCVSCFLAFISKKFFQTNERSDSKQKDSAPLVSIQYIGNTKGQERSPEGS